MLPKTPSLLGNTAHPVNAVLILRCYKIRNFTKEHSAEVIQDCPYGSPRLWPYYTDSWISTFSQSS